MAAKYTEEEDTRKLSERRGLVSSTDRSDKIRTYNYNQVCPEVARCIANTAESHNRS